MTLQACLKGDWAGVIKAHAPASTDPGDWLRYGVALLQVNQPEAAGPCNAALAFEMARSLGASPAEVSGAITASSLTCLAEAFQALGLDQSAGACGERANQWTLGLLDAGSVKSFLDQGGEIAALKIGPEVVLTAISSRLHTLLDVVKSLLGQSLRPAAVRIFLSEEPYLLDAGVDPGCEVVRELSEMEGVHVHWTPNIGPYRKFHPYVADSWSEASVGPAPKLDRLFVTVDDDTIYPPRFLEYLFRNHLKYQCTVAHRGRRMLVEAGAFRPYGQWPDGLREPRLGNLPTGQSGVLYRLADFPVDLGLEAALVLAPTADDLWIHWLLVMNGVPAVILNPNAAARTQELAFPAAEGSKEYAAASLWHEFNSGEGRQGGGGNDGQIEAINAFFLAKGFSLGGALGQEFEREADLY